MILSKVEHIQLDMSNDEAYALWCVLDEVDDANDIALPESIQKLTCTLRQLMDKRRSPAQRSLDDPRETFDAARKQVGVEPNPGNMSGDPLDMKR